MKTIGFSYGWAEGRLHSRKLEKQLMQNGYAISRDLETCDIIIAHSGGVFLLPKETKAEIILLFGVPYWPERSPLLSLFIKIKYEVFSPKPFLSRLIKNIYNVIYLFNFKHQLKIQKMFYKHGYPKTSVKTIAVSYDKDPFMDPEKSKDLALKMNWHFIRFTGQHDDIWLIEKPILDLLKQEEV